MKSRMRRLGGTDLMISAVGLGCWQFSKQKNLLSKIWPALSDERIREIVKASLDGEVNWFDTAEIYGSGESERSLAWALRAAGKKPGDVVIATKWWPVLRTAHSITATIQERRDALAPFPIDLYQIHQPFAFSCTASQAAAMGSLVKQGTIRAVGVSNFSARRMRIAHRGLERMGLRLAANQVRYSLLNRAIERNGVLDTARELGITIIAYSPLAQGVLTGKFHENPDLIRTRGGYRRYLRSFGPKGLEESRPVITALREIAERREASMSQIALSWALGAAGDTVVVIPGATSAEHARDNAGAMQIALSPEERHLLDAASSRFVAKA